jgi:hypothetical protein
VVEKGSELKFPNGSLLLLLELVPPLVLSSKEEAKGSDENDPKGSLTY